MCEAIDHHVEQMGVLYSAIQFSMIQLEGRDLYEVFKRVRILAVLYFSHNFNDNAALPDLSSTVDFFDTI